MCNYRGVAVAVPCMMIVVMMVFHFYILNCSHNIVTGGFYKMLPFKINAAMVK